MLYPCFSTYILSLCSSLSFTSDGECYAFSLRHFTPYASAALEAYRLNRFHRVILTVRTGRSQVRLRKDPGPIFSQYDSEQAWLMIELLHENTRKSSRVILRSRSGQCPVQYLENIGTGGREQQSNLISLLTNLIV